MPKLNLSLTVWVANETSFDVTSETLDQKLNAKPEFRFTQQKKGGMGETEQVTEQEQEKIHMSPYLHRASMSASYIILLHNESENPTS